MSNCYELYYVEIILKNILVVIALIFQYIYRKLVINTCADCRAYRIRLLVCRIKLINMMFYELKLDPTKYQQNRK